LRADITQFDEAGAKVVAVAPESRDAVARFVKDDEYPFPILSDDDHSVFDAYDVANKLMSLGQRPAVFVVDMSGVVRFDSVGTQQWQIPTNDAVLEILSDL
jgi:peroxiredoxin